jgi:short-subunit dehydrogenase
MITANKYGPWALVAGASEGMGEAFAHKLGEAGINLVMIARKKDLLDKTAADVRARSGVQTRTLALDLTSLDMLERIRNVTDDVDVGLLIYNAGSGDNMGFFLEAPIESSFKVMRLNPIGQVLLSHHFGKKMAARGRGGIILMGSVAGTAGAASAVTYSASKAFTQNFAEGLWAEMQPRGIDVVCVAVGATNTPARAKLNLSDKPGSIVSEPDVLAQQSLDALTDGPVFVPKHLVEEFRLYSSLPRREAAEAKTAKMLGVHRYK